MSLTVKELRDLFPDYFPGIKALPPPESWPCDIVMVKYSGEPRVYNVRGVGFLERDISEREYRFITTMIRTTLSSNKNKPLSVFMFKRDEDGLHCAQIIEGERLNFIKVDKFDS